MVAVCTGSTTPPCSGGECLQWGNIAVSQGRRLVVKEARSGRETSSLLVPSDPSLALRLEKQ